MAGLRLKVMIVAGELSGDALASDFMRDFSRIAKENEKELGWSGMGGTRMRGLSNASLLPMEKGGGAGLVELLPKAAGLLQSWRSLCRLIETEPPDLAVLVDFPDFNLRLAHRLHLRGIPVFYYAAPQLWAWRPDRIGKMSRSIDRLAVLFPFEKKWFSERGISTCYVGHPLLKSTTLGKDAGHVVKTIGLYPGSRKHEVAAILPVQIEAAQNLSHYLPTPPKFRIFAAAGRSAQIRDMSISSDIEIAGSGDQPDLAWCAAGTITLEMALSGTPFILTHKVHPLTYGIASKLVGSPYLAMPNILLKRKVAPELIQSECTASNLSRTTARLLADSSQRTEMYEAFSYLRKHILGGHIESSAAVAAWELLELQTD